MVIATDVAVQIGSDSYTGLQTLDWNPLDEEGVIEVKYYAPSIGVLRRKNSIAVKW